MCSACDDGDWVEKNYPPTKLSELKGSLICLCRNILICENGYIYKCEKCGREYQRSSSGKLMQTKRPKA